MTDKPLTAEKVVELCRLMSPQTIMVTEHGGFATAADVVRRYADMQIDAAKAENALLRDALQRIDCQAVCVGMDGDSGNADMLVRIQRWAEQALAQPTATNKCSYPKCSGDEPKVGGCCKTPGAS